MANFYDKASLVLIPSGTKEGVLFSQKPTNGDGDFTFTRASSATRVNSSGLIEKETQNLLLQSNQFDTTWTNSVSTETGGQSGYDGSSDAWLITRTGTGGRINQFVTLSGVQTFSVYAKSNDLNWMRLLTVGGTNISSYFDLQNGVVGTTTAIDANIESVGNGWYRCSATLNESVTEVRIYPADDNGDVSGSSGSIYIQDAQLNQGLVADSYLETTTTAVYGGITDDLPRLDYTDSSCPSLLLEPQRTNLYQHSEYLSNFNGDETFNAAISPEGVSNATKITKTSASDQFLNIFWTGATISPSTDYTISLFVKHSGDDVNIRYEQNSGLDWGFGWFAEFLVRSSGVTASNTNNCTSDVEDYGDGWYRILVFVTSAASVTPASASNLLRVIGASGEELLVYGAQMEQSSYATSYIPTYGSAVTRNSDNSIVTSASNLIGQTEGTLFIECEYPRTGAGGSARKLISVNDGSSANLVDIFVNAGANTLAARVRANSGGFGSIVISNNPTGVVKIAYAYKANDYVLYINGTQYGSITTGGTFTFSSELDVIQIGDGEDFNDELGGKCAQALLFKTRLTNEELAALTTI